MFLLTEIVAIAMTLIPPIQPFVILPTGVPLHITYAKLFPNASNIEFFFSRKISKDGKNEYTLYSTFMKLRMH
jgi:hypothetical protein